MLDLVIRSGGRFWSWIGLLVAVIVGAGIAYLWQLKMGLTITGLSRDVSWGFYVAQLTFLVGVAASAVMLVLPYYLHNFKEFGKITIVGEFTAVATICMCLLFLFVDLGQPARAFNVFLHPTPNSVIFWDGTVLSAYMLVNIIVGWNVLQAERNGMAPPTWIKPLILFSIPLAFCIHTVTAFLYCGLPGRSFWLTAILAPRFLASAFASGPAFLILLLYILRRVSGFDVGEKAIAALMTIIRYGLLANLFFLVCEAFVVFYSNIPEHTAHFMYLYAGLEGKHALVPWMWLSVVLMVAAMWLLLVRRAYSNPRLIPAICIMVFLGTWIDKGLGLIAGGFIPSMTHEITEYVPTVLEVVISIGVYGIGALILSILLNVVVRVRQDRAGRLAKA
ncbi:sulfate reduction electron transfer complex DsrMKJOP subunit DsrP [Desulfovibrio inopinatus]|uniref:sulfate reduction electron transfer complex DsrMKJOP subunit DsrP n=1 Tax=Desulfovibrio inopinatus TaxID=102109 RepID=UPI00041CC1FA|nr:NrfD/PsrC family molybdoenzyme membrane anchor subunit [Desulfovibrio inopinatus]